MISKREQATCCVNVGWGLSRTCKRHSCARLQIVFVLPPFLWNTYERGGLFSRFKKTHHGPTLPSCKFEALAINGIVAHACKTCVSPGFVQQTCPALPQHVRCMITDVLAAEPSYETRVTPTPPKPRSPKLWHHSNNFLKPFVGWLPGVRILRCLGL